MNVGAVQNGVMLGRDDYLFLVHGGHRVLDYATGEVSVAARSLVNFERNIFTRNAAVTRAGGKFLHVIIPDKQSILSRLIPVPVRVRLGETYIQQCDVQASVLYPRATLENQPEAFLRTDTHLTHAASIRLAAEIVGVLTDQAVEDDCTWLLRHLEAEPNFAGDLGMKLDVPRSETKLVFSGEWRSIRYHNSLLSSGNNGIVDIRFRAAAPIEARLLLFGDSFGRDLAWFLSYFFSEVVFLRTPYFHEEIFDQICPDFVVTENVERYLDQCDSDEDRTNFFMYPYHGDAGYQPDKSFAQAFSAALAFPRPPYWSFRNRVMHELHSAKAVDSGLHS